jgi:hypothetical protein
MDTANDFRILLAERGIKELQKIIPNVKVQRRKELQGDVLRLNSEIQNVKYCYLSPGEIKELDSFKLIVNIAVKLRETLEKAERDFNCLLANYWLEYIEGLPLLMDRGEISRAYEAIRYFSGEILSRTQLNGLWLCVVDCGFRAEVITNSEEFRPKKFAVVSYLPPRRFGNYVSHGMFVDAEIEKRGELSFGEIKSIAEKLGEVESVIVDLIREK